jgi:hypothetical protein
MMAMTMIITERRYIYGKDGKDDKYYYGKDGDSDSDDEITEQPQRGGSTHGMNIVSMCFWRQRQSVWVCYQEYI